MQAEEAWLAHQHTVVVVSEVKSPHKPHSRLPLLVVVVVEERRDARGQLREGIASLVSQLVDNYDKIWSARLKVDL